MKSKSIRFAEQSDWTNRVTYFKDDNGNITENRSGTHFDLDEEQSKRYEEWVKDVD